MVGMMGSQGGGSKYDEALAIIASAADPEQTKARVREMETAKNDMVAAREFLNVALDIDAARKELADIEARHIAAIDQAQTDLAAAIAEAQRITAKSITDVADATAGIDAQWAELSDEKVKLEAGWAHCREQTATLSKRLDEAAATMTDATAAKRDYEHRRDALKGLMAELEAHDDA